MTDHHIVPKGEPLPKEYETQGREELKLRLSTYIAELLDSNFEKLCNMIYRHDVAESKFNQALDSGDIAVQANEIADLVIERELQKVESRKAYRKEKENKNEKNLNESI